MKTLITITILFICSCLQAQYLTKNERDSLLSLAKYNVDVQFVKLETIKELRFAGLQDREKWLLLEHIEDAYFKFNNGRKEIEPSLLLVFMESENPVCKWNGLYEEVEERKLVKVYKVDIKVMLQIFDL